MTKNLGIYGIIIALILILFSCDLFSPKDDIPKAIQDFVDSENIPDIHSIDLHYQIEDPRLTLFSVSYGPPQDCPSGCFYQRISGLETESQIGWLMEEDYSGNIVSLSNRYEIKETESALFDTSIYSDLIDSPELQSWYWGGFASYLAPEVATPSHVLKYIVLSLHEYISPYITSQLLANPRITEEVEVLCIMYNNPLRTNQGSESAIRDSLGINIGSCDGQCRAIFN